MLASCSLAQAKPPRSFYGVVPQGKLSAADIQRMGQGRVGTIRATLPWAEIDPTPLAGDLRWKDYDAIVGAAAEEQITVLPTAYSVPKWVWQLEGCKEGDGPCSIMAPQSQLGLSSWRAFLGAAVERYGPDGSFWAGHPSIPERPIRVWQIWNEQNSPGFYRPIPDVGDYGRLLAAAAEAIRGRDPGAKIVLGGLFRYPLGGREGGIRATDYLRELYARGLSYAFDGVAIHPYAGHVSGVRHQVKRMTNVIDESGDDASVWITELGWASGGKQTPLNRGPTGQAHQLTEAFRWFTAVRKRLDIRLVAWFAWRDVPAAESRCKWCARSGLFRSGSLVAKPAWKAFRRFTGGS